MKNNKGYISTGTFFFFWVCFVFLFVCTVIIAIVGVPNGVGKGYSEGARTGTITKFSHKGIIVKSYEGELNMGGLKMSTDKNGNNSAVANIFQFSVVDPSIIKTIEEALDSGKPIKLSYTQYFIKPFGLETQYVITKADIRN